MPPLVHLHGLAISQHAKGIAVGNAHDFAAELFLTGGRGLWVCTGGRRWVCGARLAVQAIGVVRILGAAAGIATCVSTAVGRTRVPAVARVAVGEGGR